MFPLLYHTHHSLHAEDLSFWLWLAKQAKGPILELGCGSGRVLLTLAPTQTSIYGLDNDPHMLALLRKNTPPELVPTVHLLQADLTHFRVAQQFGLILLPCNTYSTLPHAARQAALACIRPHLCQGGKFAVSTPNPTLLKALPARSAAQVEEVFAHPLDGESVQVSSSWQRSSQYFTVTWRYDHLQPDGQFNRLSMQVKHHLTAVSAYLDEIRQAGFENLTLYGDFDRSPYTPRSPNLIIVVEAPS